jgi:hypothetical protein
MSDSQPSYDPPSTPEVTAWWIAKCRGLLGRPTVSASTDEPDGANSRRGEPMDGRERTASQPLDDTSSADQTQREEP